MRLLLELHLDYPSRLDEKASDMTQKLIKAVEDALNEEGTFILSFKIEANQ